MCCLTGWTPPTDRVVFEGAVLSSATLEHHLSGELLEGWVHVHIIRLQLHFCCILHLLHQPAECALTYMLMRDGEGRKEGRSKQEHFPITLFLSFSAHLVTSIDPAPLLKKSVFSSMLLSDRIALHEALTFSTMASSSSVRTSFSCFSVCPNM